MKRLILLQATSDGSCRTIRSTYGKLGGGVSRTLKAQAHDVGILQLHYDKIETTRKLCRIEKEESE